MSLKHAFTAISASTLRMMTAAAMTGAAALVMTPAQAGTQTGNLNVSLTINASCTVNGGSAALLNFGSYTGVPTGPLNQNTTFTVTCSNLAPYSVGLSAGTNGSSTSARLMKGASHAATVGYNLYLPTGKNSGSTTCTTTNWDDIAGTNFGADTGTSTAQTWTVCGNVPTGSLPSTLAVDSYTDVVTIDVGF
jgi:spore coat protein U-like protein